MTFRVSIFVLATAFWAVACNKPDVGQAGATAVPKAAPATAGTSLAPHGGDAPIGRFKANGFSPAWSAEIDGNGIRFEVPETIAPDAQPHVARVTRLAYAKGSNYEGKDGETPFSLDINGSSCDKTGVRREFTATFYYGKSIYRGCADALK